MKKIFKKNLLKSFFQSQMAVGLTLIFVTFCALIVSNSENFEIYQQFFNQNIDFLPDSLTHLTLGYDFNQNINNLPKSVNYLYFWNKPNILNFKGKYIKISKIS